MMRGEWKKRGAQSILGQEFAGPMEGDDLTNHVFLMLGVHMTEESQKPAVGTLPTNQTRSLNIFYVFS